MPELKDRAADDGDTPTNAVPLTAGEWLARDNARAAPLAASLAHHDRLILRFARRYGHDALLTRLKDGWHDDRR